MIDLSKINTEQNNPKTTDFSSMSVRQAIEIMNAEDYNAVKCIESQYDVIEALIYKTGMALVEGGRIIYMGAGTSGRLGVLDAVECPPTFGVDSNTVVGLIAGGEKAFVKAVEGSEDSKEAAIQDLKNIGFSSKDVLVGIAASGRTPYVISGLEYASEIGAQCGAVVCTKDSEISKVCDLTIEAVPGPEVLTGSTRLKAGTTTKMILNMISTISMKFVGKIYKNYMVDLKLNNQKLVARAINIIMAVTDCEKEVAIDKLNESGDNVKLAIVMILLDCDKSQAAKRLDEVKGHIGKLEEEV